MSPVNGDGSSRPLADKDWSVLRMLEWATAYFESKGIPSPRLSIEWLLGEVLSLKRLDLYLQHDRPLTSAELDTLRGWVLRRGRHEPLQYITGSTDFYNCTIEVSPAVLIPRQETEQLVDRILKNQHETKLRILDVGTGSGCIAIAIKKARPEWHVTGLDISEAALEVARMNAAANGVDIEWTIGDMSDLTTTVGDQIFDIVISNPPYILPDEADGLDTEVQQYEPAVALFHEDPLKLYSALVAFCERMDKPAKLFCEIHADFAVKLKTALEGSRRTVVVDIDYGGKDRFLSVIFDTAEP